jgi:hypothetical protein
MKKAGSIIFKKENTSIVPPGLIIPSFYFIVKAFIPTTYNSNIFIFSFKTKKLLSFSSVVRSQFIGIKIQNIDVSS